MSVSSEYYSSLVAQYNDMRYFANDPVAVVRRCSELRDVEIMGIVCSWLAFGNRKQIYSHCCDSYGLMEGRPYEYLMSRKWREFADDNRCCYRMYKYCDFASLMEVLYCVYSSYASLHDAVVAECGNGGDYLDALIRLLPTKGIPKNRTSACKRLALFLRWMVRDDGIVDIGCWSDFDKRKLLMPLDVHVNRIARHEGLLNRCMADMKAVEELTARCASIFPADPVIMDFALFGVGYTEVNKIEK